MEQLSISTITPQRKKVRRSIAVGSNLYCMYLKYILFEVSLLCNTAIVGLYDVVATISGARMCTCDNNQFVIVFPIKTEPSHHTSCHIRVQNLHQGPTSCSPSLHLVHNLYQTHVHVYWLGVMRLLLLHFMFKNLLYMPK